MAPDPIALSWQRIEGGIRIHAPESCTDLVPPASQADIASAEARLGLRLPEELAESLRRHNGGEYLRLFPCMYTPLSAGQIVSEYNLQMELERHVSQGGHLAIDGEYASWHPSWLPFASDGAGAYLFVDTREGPHRGRIGKHDKLGTFTFPPEDLWSSLSDLLEQIANALEGLGMEGYRPYFGDEDLQWKRASED